MQLSTLTIFSAFTRHCTLKQNITSHSHSKNFTIYNFNRKIPVHRQFNSLPPEADLHLTSDQDPSHCSETGLPVLGTPPPQGQGAH